jgi:hypothetical protein
LDFYWIPERTISLYIFWRSLTLPLLVLFAQHPVSFVDQYILALALALALAFVLD